MERAVFQLASHETRRSVVAARLRASLARRSMSSDQKTGGDFSKRTTLGSVVGKKLNAPAQAEPAAVLGSSAFSREIPSSMSSSSTGGQQLGMPAGRSSIPPGMSANMSLFQKLKEMKSGSSASPATAAANLARGRDGGGRGDVAGAEPVNNMELEDRARELYEKYGNSPYVEAYLHFQENVQNMAEDTEEYHEQEIENQSEEILDSLLKGTSFERLALKGVQNRLVPLLEHFAEDEANTASILTDPSIPDEEKTAAMMLKALEPTSEDALGAVAVAAHRSIAHQLANLANDPAIVGEEVTARLQGLQRKINAFFEKQQAVIGASSNALALGIPSSVRAKSSEPAIEDDGSQELTAATSANAARNIQSRFGWLRDSTHEDLVRFVEREFSLPAVEWYTELLQETGTEDRPSADAPVQQHPPRFSKDDPVFKYWRTLLDAKKVYDKERALLKPTDHARRVQLSNQLHDTFFEAELSYDQAAQKKGEGIGHAWFSGVEMPAGMFPSMDSMLPLMERIAEVPDVQLSREAIAKVKELDKLHDRRLVELKKLLDRTDPRVKEVLTSEFTEKSDLLQHDLFQGSGMFAMDADPFAPVKPPSSSKARASETLMSLGLTAEDVTKDRLSALDKFESFMDSVLEFLDEVAYIRTTNSFDRYGGQASQSQAARAAGAGGVDLPKDAAPGANAAAAAEAVADPTLLVPDVPTEKVSTEPLHFVYLPKAERAKVLPEGLPESLRRTVEESPAYDGNTYFAVRDVTIDVVNQLRQFQQRPTSEALGGVVGSEDPYLLLVGERGSGKSSVLATAVQWARRNGWLVLYVPSAHDIVNERGHITPTLDQLWDQVGVAVSISKHMLQAHKVLLDKLPVKTEAASQLPKFTGKTLGDLLRYGIQHAAPMLATLDTTAVSEEEASGKGQAAAAKGKGPAGGKVAAKGEDEDEDEEDDDDEIDVQALKAKQAQEEIAFEERFDMGTASGEFFRVFRRELSLVDSVPVLIAVDHFNSFFEPSQEYMDPDARGRRMDPLSPQKMAIPRALMNFNHHGMVNGLFLAGLSGSTTDRHFWQAHPQQQTKQMVKVPNLTVPEYEALLDHYLRLGYITRPLDRDTRTKVFHMASKRIAEVQQFMAMV